MLTNYDNQEEETHLRHYLQVVLKRKWVVIAFLIVSITLSTLYSFKTTPIYRASTMILVDKDNPNVVSIEEVMQLGGVDPAYYGTQLKILTSRSLARKVIESLNLKESPEFKPDNKSKGFSIRKLLSSLTGKASSDKKPQKPVTDVNDSALVGSYLSKLKVKPVKDSYVVNIRIEGTHPNIITTMANKHAREYIEKNLELRFAASQDAVGWLQKQLLEKKEKVEISENALQLYKEKKQIVSLEDRQNIIVQKLEELNSALTTARTDRAGLEILCKQAEKFVDQPDMIESIPDVMQSGIIEQLKMDYFNLQAEITNASDTYGEKYPAMIKLVTRAEKLEDTINSEVKKIIKSIETEYKVSLAKENNLFNALEKQKKVALDLSRKAIAYGTLKREAESERAMYDMLLKRMKETTITGELKTSNIRIIDLAEVPGAPIKPKKRSNFFLAIVIGLTLGIGTVFFLEYLDNTIKSTDDVERHLGLPVLGILEKLKASRDKEPSSIELITHEIPRSPFAEVIRNVRTSIAFSSADNPKKSVMITSSTQGEGKTFVASNLSIAIAQTGKKTLLVDTDFRRPKIYTVFNTKKSPGLSNHLIGEGNLDSIIRSTSVPNLSIITSGFLPPNPSEMLGSNNMKKFCESTRERFDVVIFDTPPSMTVTDAAVLSNIIDGVVFVIKSGVTVKEVAQRAISQITNSNREILGVVMNFVDVSRGSTYYHYYSSYYKYADDSEESTKKAEVS